MNENADAKDSASPKKKDKKHKIEKPKVKKTRRHFREELQQRDQVPQAETKPDIDQNEIVQTDTGLSPSAIVEMFHLQEENSSSTSTGTIARYLVENETSGDFYQIRSKQRKQHLHFPDHVRHRRSLMKAQQKFRDGSTKAENSMCCTILQRDGEKALVVMLLGIVTGMCWMDALNLHLDNASSSRSKFDSFVCAYSAGSNRSRHNFFVLFKYPSHGIVLHGRRHSNRSSLVRRLCQTSSRQGYKTLGDGAAAELTSYKLLQAATGLVSIALFILLVGSPAAQQLSRAHRENEKWCEEVATTSTLFRSGILILQVCTVLNTTLITLAWLLVALQCSMTMASSTTNRIRIVQLQEALSEHEKRICELQGTHLEGSCADDLKSLIQLHQRAIELTEGVLVSKLQVLHRPTAAC